MQDRVLFMERDVAIDQPANAVSQGSFEEVYGVVQVGGEQGFAITDMAVEPGRPLVVFGLSVGGMTGYLTCARGADVDGVIATNLLDMSNPEIRHASARSRFVSRVGGGIMFGMPWLFDGLKLPVRWVAPLDKMSVDDQIVKLLENDPHIGRVRIPSKFFRTLAALQPPTSAEHPHQCPLLLAHPGADLWTPTELSMGFYERITHADKEMVILDNAGHFPLEEPGLAQLMEAVLAFLGRLEGAD